MGIDGYLNQAYQTERFKTMYSEEQLEHIFNAPSWVTAAFAIAVFSSVIRLYFIIDEKEISKCIFLDRVTCCNGSNYL